MLRAMAERGERRPLALIYCNRVWEHVLFADELEALKARLNLAVIHVLGEPPPDWAGERGLLSAEIVRRHLPPGASDWDYFLCGPTPMLEIGERALREQGIGRRRIHSEIFDLA